MTQTIALIFGGRSSEHGISCVTAGGILSAIDRDRYRVIAIGIAPSGRMVLVSDDPADWRLEKDGTPQVPEVGTEVLLPAATAPAGQPARFRAIRDGRVEHLADIDAVFPLLHGPYGEDGSIQGALELLDIPYVGSGVLASAQCMDKISTKAVLAAAGLSVAPGLHLHGDRWEHEGPRIISQVRDTLPGPWFVKPSRAGSSVGVTRVTDPAHLDAAVRRAIAEDPRVLIESGIQGREVECGVLQGHGGEGPRTTVPGEVTLSDDLDFYDYESKYFGKGTVDIQIPAQLTPQQIAAVRAVATRSFTALGLEGLARVDVFVAGEAVVVNEVNTMPGFTPISMFPVLWENMGVAYGDLVSELIDLALARPRGLR